MKKIKIAIFDQNIAVRSCIISTLAFDKSFEIVGSFSDVRNCIEKVSRTRPDVILMDIEMHEGDTFDMLKMLGIKFPNIKILIHTEADDDRHIFCAIHAGASGYILRSQQNIILGDVIKDILAGDIPMSPPVTRRIVSFLRNEAPRIDSGVTSVYHLTPRETDVLSELVKGLSYKMIAFSLNISYETVRSHMKKIYGKLEVASLTEVVAKAIKDRIV